MDTQLSMGTQNCNSSEPSGTYSTPVFGHTTDKKTTLPAARSISQSSTSHFSSDRVDQRTSGVALMSEGLSSSMASSSSFSSSSNVSAFSRGAAAQNLFAGRNPKDTAQDRKLAPKEMAISLVSAEFQKEAHKAFNSSSSGQDVTYTYSKLNQSSIISLVARQIAWLYVKYLKQDGGLAETERAERPSQFPDSTKVETFQQRLTEELIKEISKKHYIAVGFQCGEVIPRNILQELDISPKFFPQRMQTQIRHKDNKIQVNIFKR